MKMATRGPAQGTNMGSMQALNTSSSVSGATTWFLNQRMSLAHSVQNQGSVGGHGPSYASISTTRSSLKGSFHRKEIQKFNQNQKV